MTGIPPRGWGESRLRFAMPLRTMNRKRSVLQALSILLVARIVPKFDPKGEGVGSMTDKRNALLLSLIEQGIHYIEEGDAQLFLVVTRSDDAETFDFFLRTAKSEDEAKIESVKAGEVVMIHRFADIFAKMLDLRKMQGGKHDLVM
jgi:hypothetical protein